MSCARGTLKQIISSYKCHLRSATGSGDNAKIVDPFLYLNIACPPGSYDANVEPAKDDVLFADSELLLGIVERWFENVYGDVQPRSSKPSGKTASTPKPRGIELLLARKEAPVESSSVSLSPVAGSTLLPPRPASKLTTHTRLHPSPLSVSALDSSTVAPRYQINEEVSGAIDHPVIERPASDETQTEAPLGLLPRHDSSKCTLSEEIGIEPSSDAAPGKGRPGWKSSMYVEDEDEEEDLEVDPRGRPRSHVDLDLDGDEHLRDVNVSNPWAFAKINAAMSHSGRGKQIHTPGRQTGDAGHFTDSSPDDLPQSINSELRDRPLHRVHQTRSSPEAAYPTPSPFPFPQKARGKRKADDTSVDAVFTPAPSNKERSKRGALDTWVQKSLRGYTELDDSAGTLVADQGPPDLPYSRDFVSARSLPPGGTPLSEIPDAPQRPRRKPALRKQQQDNIGNPFISPVSDPNRVWFDTGETLSQKRPRKPRSTNDHQDTAAAPTLTLRDDEIDEDEPVIAASAERSLPPMHPDLAITLDYEARKQKASEAHRRTLREQAAAKAAAAKLAAKAPADAPDSLHPQHAATSPHKNRQAKAIAALHASDAPAPSAPPPAVPGTTTALDPSDPRAHLLRIHQDGEQASEPVRGKSKRQKTALLPFETVTEANYVGGLVFVVEDVNGGDVEADMKESGLWDQYVRSGEVGDAFEGVGLAEVERWGGKLRGLVGGMYAVDGEEGESSGLGINLLKALQAHAAEHA